MRKIGTFTLLFTGVLLIIGSIALAIRYLLLSDIVWGEFSPCCPYCAPRGWAALTTLRDINMDVELFVRLHWYGAVLALSAGITGIVFGIVIGVKQSGRFADKEK